MKARRAALLALLLVGCRHASPAPPDVELVESAPLETTLDHADIPDAADVWPAMIDGAARSIDLAEFYASNAPASRLERVVQSLERAADRGVHVRFLVEKIFVEKYPDTLERLRKRAGVEVRVIDFGARAGGGILHAKYFVIDGREAFLGSQNFDWRALDHIFEMGARVRRADVVTRLAAIFADDWAAAGGAAAGPAIALAPAASDVIFAASPKGTLPAGVDWELPILVRWIDEARASIRVELLTYTTRSRDGSAFPDLDDALRRAAARGVRVHLLISNWGAKDESLPALARVPNVRVSILTVPPWSGGEVPFGRVAHAKYMVIDEARAWIGTSNWEGDYFLHSRNVSLFLDRPAPSARLARVFDDAAAAYARPLALP